MEAQQDTPPQKQEIEFWPRVAIIVLNRNGWRDTVECLESLQRLPVVIRELARLNYHRYSNGFLSFLKDFLSV